MWIMQTISFIGHRIKQIADIGGTYRRSKLAASPVFYRANHRGGAAEAAYVSHS